MAHVNEMLHASILKIHASRATIRQLSKGSEPSSEETVLCQHLLKDKKRHVLRCPSCRNADSRRIKIRGRQSRSIDEGESFEYECEMCTFKWFIK